MKEKNTCWQPLEEYNWPNPNYFKKLKKNDIRGEDYTGGFFKQFNKDLFLFYIRRSDDYKTTTIAEASPTDKRLTLILYLADGYIREGTIAGAETMEFLIYQHDVKEGRYNNYQIYLADVADYFSDKLSFLAEIPTKNKSYSQELITLEKLVKMRRTLRKEKASIEQIGTLIWSQGKTGKYQDD